MYIKSFYALCVAYAALFGSLLILIMCERSTLAMCGIGALLFVCIVSLLIAEVLQRAHNRLERLHRAHEYASKRARFGFAR